MRGLLFLYDIVLLVGLSLALAGFVIAYAVKREPVMLWVAVFFGISMLDHCVLFMAEFLDTDLPEILGSVGGVLYALLPPALIACERRIASMVFDWRMHPVEWALIVAFSILFVADTSLPLPDLLVRILSYGLLVYMIAVWVVSFMRLRTMREGMEEGHYRFLFLLIVLSLGLFLAGNIVEVTSPKPLFSPSLREPGSELFTCVLLLFAYIYLWRVFFAVRDEGVLRADALDRFGRVHDLTTREREVLSLIVDGRSNQEIGNELWLSLGTVKTHCHNIYRKVGVAKRNELLGTFTDFERGM